MLTDIVIGRSALGSDRTDIHRSAALNCMLGTLSRRISRFFSGKR